MVSVVAGGCLWGIFCLFYKGQYILCFTLWKTAMSEQTLINKVSQKKRIYSIAFILKWLPEAVPIWVPLICLQLYLVF